MGGWVSGLWRQIKLTFVYLNSIFPQDPIAGVLSRQCFAAKKLQNARSCLFSCGSSLSRVTPPFALTERGILSFDLSIDIAGVY